MITINLLPVELQVSTKKGQANQVYKIGIGFLVLLVVLTVFFYIDFLVAKVQLSAVEKQWEVKQPEYQALTQLRNEVQGTLKEEKDFMERFVTSPKPLTTILVWLNSGLPDTGWLTEVTMTREEGGGKLFVKGVMLPSKEKSTIELIEKYMQYLKEMMPDANLSLTTSRQKVEEVSVTQFVSQFTWKGGAVS